MNLKKVFSENLVSGLVGLSMTGLGALLVTIFGDWAAVGQGIAAVWNYVGADMSVPRWLVGLVALWSVLSTVILVALRIHASAPSDNNWRSYYTDKFYGMRWSWKFTDDGQPYHLSTFCPVCDYQLDCWKDSPYHAVDSVRFECHCGAGPWRFEESVDLLKNRVGKMIQQRVRTGTWNEQRGNASA